MKALIQRVSRASVSVGGEVVGQIGRGLVVLVGVASGDTKADAQYLAGKTAGLRIFSDDTGKFNLAALDTAAELLVVSQFTLLADTRRGRRPSFTNAATPDDAIGIFHEFVIAVEATGLRVATGRFREHMMLEIHNDGPVTIILESRERESRQLK